ncbi:MAG TPA: hypothetical protein VGN57_15250 [Pirellulaceae bacterium]|jgi:hypothetical protein|nr:hypothetical protein [Pirellulaceae bacterium]
MAESSLTRYPPFWVYLFSVAALVGLTIVQPKLESRQRAIEGAAVKRDAVARGNPAAAVEAEASGQRVPFWPLYLALAVAAVVAGGMTFARYFRSRGQRTRSRGEGSDQDAANQEPT